MIYSKNKFQNGVTLVELMVGISIGLLTVVASLGALMASRGISGSVSEASSLQQQAAYAFRVMGQQIRQAGGIELNLDPDFAKIGASGVSPELSPVAFDPPDPAGVKPYFNRTSSTVTGKDSPSTSEYNFTVGYQNYTEDIKSATGTTLESQLRDCLGNNSKTNPPPVLLSKFKLKDSANPQDKKELICAGADNVPQAIIQNVVDMVIWYTVQDNSSGTSKMNRVNAAGVEATTNKWAGVYAVEVCLELEGSEVIDTASTSYKNCNDVSTLRGNHLKMVFRNVFQIRSQGQPKI